jgi:phosphoglycerol transferase MdoB-like AlkP superfamily enzyme
MFMLRSPSLSGRLSVLLIFLLTFLGINLLTRLGLAIYSHAFIDLDGSLLGAFAIGTAYDLLNALYFLTGIGLLLTLIPNRIWNGPVAKGLIGLCLVLFSGIWLFTAVAEFTFWEEFGVRFNFIAVDYLVYTQEVLRNIRESYPLGLIFAGIIIGSTLMALPGLRWLFRTWDAHPPETLRLRWAGFAGLVVITSLSGLAIHQHQIPFFTNNYHRELAKNGTYSLFSAFWNNELSYPDFYPMLSTDELEATIREKLDEETAPFVSGQPGEWARQFNDSGTEHKWNVIQITVESLSAEYLENWGADPELTPNLNKLVKDSLVLGNLYATGTRTVRGMEALTTLLPPTPGRSLVKRPYGDRVPTVAEVFKERGYRLSFLYGGNGYFDNMNQFFSANGYTIIDEPTRDPDTILFENAWGASDEDLYGWALEEADAEWEEGKPFHEFIMTTSNHRPYTYPENRVSIPSGTGREGAVAYTDWAIGDFIRKARAHPWFKDTVFLIVADHCSGSARKAELDVSKYQIPAIFYAPGLVEPEWNTTMCSQIDVLPTLFDLLNWNWTGTSFGESVYSIDATEQRAYFGNYQKLARLHDNKLTILSPLAEPHYYQWNPANDTIQPTEVDPHEVRATIATYQGTDQFLAPFKNGS